MIPKTLFFAWFLTAANVFGAFPPTVPEVVLWPNGAPGSEGATGKEIYDHDPQQHWGFVKNIHRPAMYVYLPAKEKANGTAVIVVPGGGNAFVCIEHEGEEIATWLNHVGIAAFVLKYRLQRTEGSHYRADVESLQDAQRAIRTVRSRAKEWNINPERVGMMGFSAGGAITFLAATRFADAAGTSQDPIDRLSARPDFAVLAYGGGRTPPEFLKPEALKDVPPIFLVAAADDPLVKTWTADVYDALVKAGVPAEIHVYRHGGHGFALRDVVMNGPHAGTGGYPVFTWNARLWEWLEDVDVVPRTPLPSRR